MSGFCELLRDGQHVGYFRDVESAKEFEQIHIGLDPWPENVTWGHFGTRFWYLLDPHEGLHLIKSHFWMPSRRSVEDA